MKRISTSLPGILLLEPQVFGDGRGFFLESYNQRTFADLGIPEPFVQDNHSYSEKNVVRGLHYQIRQPQGKLVRVITGEILDVALDLRRSSPTFGKWVTQATGSAPASSQVPTSNCSTNSLGVLAAMTSRMRWPLSNLAHRSEEHRVG